MGQRNNAPVVLRDGARGAIEAWREDDGAALALVRVDGSAVWVHADALTLQSDGSYALPVERAQLDGQATVIPVLAEELHVDRRVVETGTVRLRKVVHQRQEVVAPTVTREVIDVQRVPVDRIVEGPVAPRQEGDTLVVPVLEETLVVEKRLRLVEELRITVRREQQTAAPQSVTLRREEILVERDAPAATPRERS